MDPTDPFDTLIRKKLELENRVGRLHPDGFKEFVQLVEKAYLLKDSDPAEAERLRRKADDLMPAVEKAVQQAIIIRDRIKAKMMGHAAEAMETYSEVLKELAK